MFLGASGETVVFRLGSRKCSVVLPQDLSEELGYIESDGREGTPALLGFKSIFWYYFIILLDQQVL